MGEEEVIPELGRTSQIGDRVSWKTLDGSSYEGTLVEWDSNVAIVRLDDGSEKAVET